MSDPRPDTTDPDTTAPGGTDPDTGTRPDGAPVENPSG